MSFHRLRFLFGRGKARVSSQLNEELLGEVREYVAKRFDPCDFEPRVFSACEFVKPVGSVDPVESVEPVEPAMRNSVCEPCSQAVASEPRFADWRETFSEADSIDELLGRKTATFSEALMSAIDARNLSDPEVYRRANVDRKLFSKIRSNAHYRPKKSTAVALALALGMNLDDTLDLIGRAGYTLTMSSKADIIVMYFIERECWDVNLINQVLYEFDQPLVGC